MTSNDTLGNQHPFAEATIPRWLKSHVSGCDLGCVVIDVRGPEGTGASRRVRRKEGQ